MSTYKRSLSATRPQSSVQGDVCSLKTSMSRVISIMRIPLVATTLRVASDVTADKGSTTRAVQRDHCHSERELTLQGPAHHWSGMFMVQISLIAEMKQADAIMQVLIVISQLYTI